MPKFSFEAIGPTPDDSRTIDISAKDLMTAMTKFRQRYGQKYKAGTVTFTKEN